MKHFLLSFTCQEDVVRKQTLMIVVIGVTRTPMLVCFAHYDAVTPHEGVHSTPNFGWCDAHPVV